MGIINICMDFRTAWPKMRVFFVGEGQMGGRSDRPLNELVFTFGGSYVSVNFGKRYNYVLQ